MEYFKFEIVRAFVYYDTTRILFKATNLQQKTSFSMQFYISQSGPRYISGSLVLLRPNGEVYPVTYLTYTDRHNMVTGATEWLVRRFNAVKTIVKYWTCRRIYHRSSFKSIMQRYNLFNSKPALLLARRRLDRLIEYTTRPDSEYTQQLMARQLRGTASPEKNVVLTEVA